MGEEHREKIWIAKEGRARYDALQERARSLALRIAALADEFPRTPSGKVFADQLVRCATSTACNHRSARRARSKAEWIAKLGIVEEEADEMIFWLGMSRDKGFLEDRLCTELTIEANEILSIIVASIKTARANNRIEKKSRTVRL